MAASHCDACVREFVDEAALRMHVQHSKIHKKEIKKQKMAQRPDTAPRVGPSTLQPVHIPHGFRTNTRNAFAIPTEGGLKSAIDFEDPGCMEAGILATEASHIAADMNLSVAMHNLAVSQPLFGYHEVPTDWEARALADGYLGSDASPIFPVKTETKLHCGLQDWSLISLSRQLAALETLLRHCHPSADLTRNNYLLRPRKNEELSGQRKCRNCGGRQKMLQVRPNSICSFHPGKRRAGERDSPPKPYPCCGTMDAGCCSLQSHVYPNLDRRLVAKNNAFAFSLPSSPWAPKLQAVALDCEMVAIQGGMNELVYICAVNYLTGETILNTLVRPDAHVIDWRTRYSGVTKDLMTAATGRGEALNGWKEARARLWEYVDADTVLIGHALQHDLDALRMMHSRVVDSAILASNAVDPEKRSAWGLRTLCDQLLQIRIQDHGRRGHDCLEDTLAARALVLFCTHNPHILGNWAEKKRKEQEAKRELERKERETKRELARKEKETKRELEENGRSEGKNLS